ncbi:MAG: radical SAM protein [Deltaproteobacteria bacterium]|nr:radical SAM protein [Deltaproteobacteria bacterium]
MKRTAARKKCRTSDVPYKEHERSLLATGTHRVGLRVALAFPNTYAVGMSNLGFQLVYRLLCLHPEVCCERFFLPDSGQSAGTLRSIESGAAPGSFDCIAFSLSFESDYLNVVHMLALAGIPALRSERQQGAPLLVAGGVAVSMNPEPLADIFDLFAIGEAEALLPDFIERALACLQPGCAHRLRAEDFDHIGGFYAPGLVVPLYDGERLHGMQGSAQAGLPVAARRPADLNTCHGSSCILTPHTQFADMALVEVSRGCPRGCRFCAVSSQYAPFRRRSLVSLVAEIEPLLQQDIKIGLLGAAVSDHPNLEELMRHIVERGGHVSISSLRADALTAHMVALLAACGHTTFTIAPEAATQRLRDVLGKGISHSDIMRAVEIFAAQGVSSIRLYFMIGLPGERDEDIDAIAELAVAIAARYRAACGGRDRLRRLTLSISPFVPKSFTPFQWHGFEPLDSLKHKLARIQAALRTEKKIQLSCDSPRMSLVQALLSTGDRRLSKILLSAHALGSWPRAFRQEGYKPEAVVCRRRSRDEFLPWDVLDHGIDKDMLWRAYQKALKGL